MATPVFCCGAECGASGAHLLLNGSNGGFNTSTFRSGLRSFSLTPSASTDYWTSTATLSSSVLVARLYIYFNTLPNADCHILTANFDVRGGVLFRSSDNSLYAGYIGGGGVFNFGSDRKSVV